MGQVVSNHNEVSAKNPPSIHNDNTYMRFFYVCVFGRVCVCVCV